MQLNLRIYTLYLLHPQEQIMLLLLVVVQQVYIEHQHHIPELLRVIQWMLQHHHKFLVVHFLHLLISQLLQIIAGQFVFV